MADKPKAPKSPKYQYAEKLKDPRWQKLRLQVFDRDGWKCRSCDSSSNTLHAHHSYYDPESEGPWDYSPDTIVTLCEECHESEHTGMQEIRNELTKSIAHAGFLTGADLLFLADVLMEISWSIDNNGQDHTWAKTIASHIANQVNRKIGGDDHGQD